MQYEQIMGRSLHDAMARAKSIFGNDIVLLETQTLSPRDPDYDENHTTRITVGFDSKQAAQRRQAMDAYQWPTQEKAGADIPEVTRENQSFHPFFKASLENEPVRPVSPEPESRVEVELLRGQIHDLHGLLARIVQPNLQGAYAGMFENMTRLGMDQKDALEFIGMVQTEFRDRREPDPADIRQALRREVFPFTPHERVTDILLGEGQRVLSFVGSPGVGKTTTLMKIALHPAMAPIDSIGILSLDAYGMGAGKALNTFCRLTGIAEATVTDEESLSELLNLWSDKQVILVDTPGRSPNFPNYIRNLRHMLQIIQPTESYVVFDMRSDLEDMYASGERFSVLKPTGMIATKFDETTRPGKVISLSKTLSLPVVFACDGQEVTGRYKPFKLQLFTDQEIINETEHST
ncbi:MAG: hypothetical protein K9N34_00935 [Candidatus Marinimicrobia bacterium]|nr:hypothetical protein [Candidatus Neomarinimicrobiota bacterium]MCF7841142.1 hypothetical protein [Candidatus Neomarinimicrobiota bacterium]MCF7902402.1 hypothetical protein [Candidatus Neomarinimicrobiota bacterium]